MTAFRSWTIGPFWKGEDAFVLCGGPSLDPEFIQRLRGRPRSRVIAINQSYLIAPWADMLFFADDRWWKRETTERPEALKHFEGQIVTIARHSKHELLWHVHRVIPEPGKGLSKDGNTVAMERTSLHAVLNICLHKSARRIILIGADNKEGADGRIHHHAEYPWSRKKDTWALKMEQLAFAVKPLADAGIEVINASTESTLPWWPKVNLAAWLDEEDRKAALWEGMP